MKSITIIVDDKMAVTIMSLLADQAIDSIRVDTVVNGAKSPRHIHRESGTKLSDILKEAFPQKFTFDQATRLAVKRGYAQSSAGAALNYLKKDGRVVKEGINFKFVR